MRPRREKLPREKSTALRIPRVPLDQENRAASLEPTPGFPETGIRGHRQDKPSAVLERIEPNVRRPGDTGVDINDIGGREGHRRPVAFDHPDASFGEIGRGLRRKTSIVFDRRHIAGRSREMRQDGGVVAGPCANMDDLVAGFDWGLAINVAWNDGWPLLIRRSGTMPTGSST